VVFWLPDVEEPEGSEGFDLVVVIWHCLGIVPDVEGVGDECGELDEIPGPYVLLQSGICRCPQCRHKLPQILFCSCQLFESCFVTDQKFLRDFH
jgi:hypothetical protein